VKPVELAAEGAPVEQGRAQGRRFALAIAGELLRQRRALPWLARRSLVARVRETSARAVATQLPWQRERIEGIALEARVALGGLELAEACERIQGAAFVEGATLQASFDLPRELEALLVLRSSRPDAGGFPSVELALAHLAGCLCGVNAEGIAVLCVRDLSRDEPSLRFHAQEILFRARDLGAGIDHLRRRASYAGGTGTLVVADAGGASRVLEFARGALEVRDTALLPARAAAPMVEIDAAARRLVWCFDERREAFAR
jgi:hypothetical protein